MNDHIFHRRDVPRRTPGLWQWVLIGAIGIGMLVAGLPAQASESQAPWECSSYTGDAHTRCVETFIEIQRDQIAALQRKLQAQQEIVNQLKTQLDRQSSANADLQRQLSRPPAVVQTVPPYYAYPPVGLSLNFGSPWMYGSPLYAPPYYFGPYYYGPRWGFRW
jgi:uncharacterized coiled-coil protein SlyX